MQVRYKLGTQSVTFTSQYEYSGTTLCLKFCGCMMIPETHNLPGENSDTLFYFS